MPLVGWIKFARNLMARCSILMRFLEPAPYDSLCTLQCSPLLFSSRLRAFLYCGFPQIFIVFYLCPKTRYRVSMNFCDVSSCPYPLTWKWQVSWCLCFWLLPLCQGQWCRSELFVLRRFSAWKIRMERDMLSGNLEHIPGSGSWPPVCKGFSST